MGIIAGTACDRLSGMLYSLFSCVLCACKEAIKRGQSKVFDRVEEGEHFREFRAATSKGKPCTYQLPFLSIWKVKLFSLIFFVFLFTLCLWLCSCYKMGYSKVFYGIDRESRF